jgi:hypothetical protein
VERRDRIAAARGVAHRGGYGIGGMAHGLARELALATGEVVVDRAARRRAVRDDVAQARPREAALAEQQRGAARHLLADVGPRLFVAGGYDGDHMGAAALRLARAEEGPQAAEQARPSAAARAPRRGRRRSRGARGQRLPALAARLGAREVGLPALDER